MTKRRGHSRRPDTVVCYARVSTVEQAERDLSLPAQLDAMKRFASERSLVVTNDYVEPGASGTDDNRPQFQLMLEEVLASDSPVSAILCYQTSRFMRNVGKARFYKDKLRKSGVRVVAISQETSDDAHGHLVEHFFEAIDQYESEVNGMRTRAAMRENAKRGFVNGSRTPFGFSVLKVEVSPGRKRNKLVQNHDEADVLRVVFKTYVHDSGAMSTAKELNGRGYRYRGKLWTKDHVLKVIGETAGTCQRVCDTVCEYLVSKVVGFGGGATRFVAVKPKLATLVAFGEA